VVVANRSQRSLLKSVPATIGDFGLDEEDRRFDALCVDSTKGKGWGKTRRRMTVGCVPSFRR